FIAEAAFLARATGQPVRVQWAREDDVRHDYYNAVNTQLLTAGLDERGKVVAWRLRTAFPPISSTFKPTNQPSADDLQQGVTDRPLAVPNVRAETCRADVHVRIGWLRSVYNIFHAFSVNSFIDEIAHARGEDPRAVQLEILGPNRIVTLAELGVDKLSNYSDSLEKHPIDTGRWRRVIERATEMARWDQRRKDGRVLGLAAHRSFLTYVAVVVSVVRNEAGLIGVDEAWVDADAHARLERISEAARCDHHRNREDGAGSGERLPDARHLARKIGRAGREDPGADGARRGGDSAMRWVHHDTRRSRPEAGSDLRRDHGCARRRGDGERGSGARVLGAHDRCLSRGRGGSGRIRNLTRWPRPPLALAQGEGPLQCECIGLMRGLGTNQRAAPVFAQGLRCGPPDVLVLRPL